MEMVLWLTGALCFGSLVAFALRFRVPELWNPFADALYGARGALSSNAAERDRRRAMMDQIDHLQGAADSALAEEEIESAIEYLEEVHRLCVAEFGFCHSITLEMARCLRLTHACRELALREDELERENCTRP